MTKNIVLVSGGWDSTYCLVKALAELGGITHLLTTDGSRRRAVQRARSGADELACYFFEYGQPYLAQERAAVEYLRRRFAVRIDAVAFGNIGRAGAIFADRNRRFIERALRQAEPWDKARVWFGTRNVLPWWDEYGDSNALWARRLARTLSTEQRPVEIRTPAAGFPKWLVKRQLTHAAVIVPRLFSSEGFAYEATT